MTPSMSFRVHYFLTFVVAFPILVASSHARAEEGGGEVEYPFVAQKARNSLDRFMCAGLAGGIECLEEGTEVEGVESSEDLAGRLWNELSDSDYEDDEFVYYSHLRLRDAATVPVCSKAAMEEIGFLIQEEYSHTVRTKLWQVQVEYPDPNTPEGRVLLETRQKYLDLRDKEQDNQITNEADLKDLCNDEDEDGLVALSGRGQRFFENGPPPKLIDKYKLKIDPLTGKYPAAVPSLHAFLLTYDEVDNLFYVYDSDDPDGKWPVTVQGSGNRFMIHWRIDDHMGNGPSQQMYYDVRPLDQLIRDTRDIVEGDDGGDRGGGIAGGFPLPNAESTQPKTIEP